MEQNSRTIFAARVADMGDRLVRDDDVISLFTEAPHVSRDGVEAGVRPHEVLHPSDFSNRYPGAIVPTGTQVVQVNVEVTSEVVNG